MDLNSADLRDESRQINDRIAMVVSEIEQSEERLSSTHNKDEANETVSRIRILTQSRQTLEARQREIKVLSSQAEHAEAIAEYNRLGEEIKQARHELEGHKRVFEEAQAVWSGHNAKLQRLQQTARQILGAARVASKAADTARHAQLSADSSSHSTAIAGGA